MKRAFIVLCLVVSACGTPPTRTTEWPNPTGQRTPDWPQSTDRRTSQPADPTDIVVNTPTSRRDREDASNAAAQCAAYGRVARQHGQEYSCVEPSAAAGADPDWR